MPWTRFLFALVIACSAACPARGQDPVAPGAAPGSGVQDPGVTPPAERPRLNVVTKDSPPFAFRGPGGTWQGISIDLWRLIAERLGVDFELSEAATPDEMVRGVSDGTWDVAVGALSVTAERIGSVEFTHPFFTTGLGVMTHDDAGGGWRSWLEALLSPGMLVLIGSLIGGLLLAGVMLWGAERRKNPLFKDSKAGSGVGTGMWLSTLLFLGHKGVFPATVFGRVLALSVMVLSVVLLSVLTGAIASQLTVEQLNTFVRSASDLDRVRTVAVRGTSGAAFLRGQRIRFEEVESLDAGMEGLRTREFDALVHDQPLLEYLLERGDDDDLRVLPRTLDTQDYAFALRPESSYRKPANAALLELRSSSAWADIRYQYLGR